ncbi:hypothetical protein BYT27DRAFT_7182676 [Phlegmacium glaucopus]|nr:hypothetical protein BYT27DRAFT_7182676 [Phlegmacium glaucopus]
MSNLIFDKTPSLRYLGLPQDYEPSPVNDPIAFLSKHLLQLPPHLLMSYTHVTTPKQRTAIATIRNRRLQYANKNPPDLQFNSARITWPGLWQGQERQVGQNGDDERAWVQSDFLKGKKQFVGKLGNLLAAYEEERESECIRTLRRSRATTEDNFVPEEDSDSDSDPNPQEKETEEEAKASFERLIRELFVYGRLENMDYDKIDWDESLGIYDDREAEDRWFDEDEDN